MKTIFLMLVLVVVALSPFLLLYILIAIKNALEQRGTNDRMTTSNDLGFAPVPDPPDPRDLPDGSVRFPAGSDDEAESWQFAPRELECRAPLALPPASTCPQCGTLIVASGCACPTSGEIA